MKRKNSQKGSALIWVLVISVIFLILGLSLGWVALSMNNRSLKNDELQESYFTARSAVDAILKNLSGYTDDDSKTTYNYLHANLINGGKSVSFNTASNDIFSNSTEMNACNVTGSICKGMVKLTATAGTESGTQLGDTRDQVTLWGKRALHTSNAWPSESWAVDLAKYPTQAFQNNKWNNQFVVGESTDGAYATNSNLDVAVYKTAGNGTTYGAQNFNKQSVSTKLCVTKDQLREVKAIFIYVEERDTLVLSGMDYHDKTGSSNSGTSNNSQAWFWDTGGNPVTNEQWKCYYGPEIYIYLKSGSKLQLKSNSDSTGSAGTVVSPYPVYIYGDKSATIKPVVETVTPKVNNVYPDILVYGYDSNVLNIKNTQGTLKVYKDDNGKEHTILSGYPARGVPSDSDDYGLFNDTWEVYQYERNALPQS